MRPTHPTRLIMAFALCVRSAGLTRRPSQPVNQRPAALQLPADSPIIQLTTEAASPQISTRRPGQPVNWRSATLRAASARASPQVPARRPDQPISHRPATLRAADASARPQVLARGPRQPVFRRQATFWPPADQTGSWRGVHAEKNGRSVAAVSCGVFRRESSANVKPN